MLVRLVLIFWFAVLPKVVFADPQPVTVEKAFSGDTLALSDGRILRLEGIKAPSGQTPDLAVAAQAQLQNLAARKIVDIHDSSLDRYGRIVGQGYIMAKKDKAIWLQEEMLRSGLAFVYPPTGIEFNLSALLKAEDAARAAKIGIWSDGAYADTFAADAGKHEGHFAFVVGNIVDVKEIKNRIYLNFGKDWHNDFTAIIAAHDRRRFLKAGTNPQSYQGKTVRVRGWVKRDRGPIMAVTFPEQIQLIGDMKRPIDGNRD